MVKKFCFCVVFCAIAIFGGNTEMVYANTESCIIDPSIYDREISEWISTETYEKDELVILSDRIYEATEKVTGKVPGEDAVWVCKADLANISALQSCEEIKISNESSKLRSSIETTVLLFNGNLMKSKYTFSVRSIFGGAWSVGVSSLITYDGGKHSILKLDNFSDASLFVSVSQSKNYYYNNMTTVKVYITGTYDGQVLEPASDVLTAE